MEKRKTGNRKARILKAIFQHQDGKITVFIHHRSRQSFINPFVIKFGFLSGAVDSTEVPASLDASEDDPCSCIAMVEKIDRRPNEEAV